MIGAEGKLFQPLAYTKTFALIASIVIALTLIPPLAHVLFTGRFMKREDRRVFFMAVATVSFEVPRLYAGTVHFVAKRVDGIWTFIEFMHPGYEVRTVLGADGKWRVQ